MRIVNELFGINSNCTNVKRKGKSLIVELDNKKYVIKVNTSDINDIYKYLSSRNFNSYPKLLLSNSRYNVYEYIENIDSPIEQKAYDMISIISLLHEKTTYYKEGDINDYKKIFEDVINKIDDVNKYYNRLIDSIENHMFMSPSEYLVARNINKILGALNYSKESIIKWYDIVKTNNKNRVVTLYNNMDLNHIIKNDKLYLISWEKSIKGNPIYDIYNFYNTNYNIVDFSLLLKHYEDKYPLQESEKILFYTLISIPDKIEFTYDELKNCKKVKKIVDYIYKSEILINEIK